MRSSLLAAELVDRVTDVTVRSRQMPEDDVAHAQFGAVEYRTTRTKHPYVPIVLQDQVDGTSVGCDGVHGQKRSGFDLDTPDRHLTGLPLHIHRKRLAARLQLAEVG